MFYALSVGFGCSQFVPVSVLPPTKFNWPVLMATCVEQIPVVIMLCFLNFQAQQLGTGENLKLAEGSECT